MSPDRIIVRDGIRYSIRRRAGWFLVDRLACDCILGPHSHDLGAARTLRAALDKIPTPGTQQKETTR